MPGVQRADHRRQHRGCRLGGERAEVAEARRAQQDGEADSAQEGVRKRVREHHARGANGERERVEGVHRRVEEAVHAAGHPQVEDRRVDDLRRPRAERGDELRGEDLDEGLHGERHADGEGEPDAQRFDRARRPFGAHALRGGGGYRLPDRPAGEPRERARLEPHARRRGDVGPVGVQDRGHDHVGDVDDRLLHGPRHAQAQHLERFRPRALQGRGEGAGAGEARTGDRERRRSGSSLRGDGRPGRAGHAHAEPHDEHEVERDVARRGERHRQHRRARVPLSLQERAGGVHEERAAGRPADDADVGSGVSRGSARHAHGGEQRDRPEEGGRGDRRRERGADDEERREGPALAGYVGGARPPGDDRPAARREADHYRADDEGDRRGVAHGDERRLAQDVADYGHVGELVEVLEEVGCHEGRREGRHAPGQGALGEERLC